MFFGEYDEVARLTIEDLDKLEEFVSQSIRTVPNVLVTSTMIISREHKGKTADQKTSNSRKILFLKKKNPSESHF